MGRLSVNLCGEELDNPVIPASGTFGYGYEFAELYDINCLGTFSFKGTTKEPRFGNPTPRIAECTAGMINAVGLQNPGVDKVISEELPRLKKCFNKKVMANVSGFSVDEYAYTCEKLDSQEQVGWLEVNVSCPNVHGGGMSFGTDPKAAAEVTKAVKAVTKKPVIIKLSPNVTDIVSIAKACEDAGADGISLINTLLGMRIDLRTKKPVIANTMGGFSGSCIMYGVKRGLYSNEAGMGSAPNAAATASVSHPAKQGLVQMLSVFIDTLLICTATAFMCLSTNVVPTEEIAGAVYVQNAIASTLGAAGPVFLAVAMMLFAFTTLLGNYSYCEGCLEFILHRSIKKHELLFFRLFATAIVFIGAIANAGLVWDTADMLQGMIVVVNVPTILILGGTAIRCLNDYVASRKRGENPVFHAKNIGIKEETDFWK